jgi:hypothetical protein
MIDSKRFLPSLLPCKISPGAYIYIYTYLCNCLLSFQLSPVGAGTCWSIYSQRPPTTTHLFFFFLLLRKAIKIGPCASHCSLPLATFDPQHTAKARRVPPFIPDRVYPLHQAGAGSLPVLVSPHRHPLATAIWPLASPGDQDSRTCFFTPGALAGQLELLLFAICHPVTSCKPSLPACPPHSTMLGQPLGFFYMNYALAVCFPLLTSWLLSPSTSEPNSQSLNVLAIW